MYSKYENTFYLFIGVATIVFAGLMEYDQYVMMEIIGFIDISAHKFLILLRFFCTACGGLGIALMQIHANRRYEKLARESE
jgi:hypothetical protein